MSSGMLKAVIVFCLAFVVAGIYSVEKKQKNDRAVFMSSCLQEKKQFECDVLWAQTDESKQVRDLAIGLAAGAAIGAAAGRK